MTALIIDAYDALGAAGERSYAAAARAGTDPGGQWLQVFRACRRWALAHPHGFALGYGSPVPGYAAPADTVGPATRVPRLLARVLRAAAAADVLMPRRQPGPKVPLVTAQVLAIAGPAPPQPFADLIERSLVLWVVLMDARTSATSRVWSRTGAPGSTPLWRSPRRALACRYRRPLPGGHPSAD